MDRPLEYTYVSRAIIPNPDLPRRILTAQKNKVNEKAS